MNEVPLPALLLGLLFGIQHATDADHVIAVATIVARTGRFSAGALVGAFWAIGHTVTITVVGILIVVFHVAFPPRVALSFEFAAAAMLMWIGAQRIGSGFRRFDPGAGRHPRHA